MGYPSGSSNMTEDPWALVTIPGSYHVSIREIDQDQTRQALWQSLDKLDVGSHMFIRPMFKLSVRMAELHRKHQAANSATPDIPYIPPTDADVDDWKVHGEIFKYSSDELEAR